MKVRELRDLSSDELVHKMEGLKKQLMELQFKRRTGVEKPHLFKQVKKQMAQILTLLKEKENEVKNR